jgi:hypothetical protein
MDVQGLFVERRIAASLLILCFVLFIVPGFLFTGRAIWKWPAAQTPIYLYWERGLVITAFLMNVLGFVLLEDLLRNAGDIIIARMAIVIYLVSAVVLVVAETIYLNNRDWIYPQIVVHVVLALLVQAAFGVALLQTGVVAPWVGWATIIWNLGFLVILPIATPHNIYFPVLHHVAPLIIGISLLIRS